MNRRHVLALAALCASLGTGLLAAFARRAGASLVLNELDPARAEMLQAAFPGVSVTRHDAELIHDLLSPEQPPPGGPGC